jgi:membrane protease YdiL (CAAX protease family)
MSVCEGLASRKREGKSATRSGFPGKPGVLSLALSVIPSHFGGVLFSDSDPPPSEGIPIDRKLIIPAAIAWVLFASALLISFIALTVSARPGLRFDVVNSGLCQAMAYLLAIYGIMRLHMPNHSASDVLGMRRSHIAVFPLAFVSGVLLQLPASWLSEIVLKSFPYKNPEEQMAMAIQMFDVHVLWRKLVVAFMVVGLGPLVEEFLFRGALFRVLRRQIPSWIVILVMATTFSLVHLDSRLFPAILFCGVVLGYLREVSGTIFASMIAHQAFNAVTTMISFSKPSLILSPPATPLWAAALGTVGLGLCLFALRFLSQRSEIVQLSRSEDMQ